MTEPRFLPPGPNPESISGRINESLSDLSQDPDKVEQLTRNEVAGVGEYQRYMLLGGQNPSLTIEAANELAQAYPIKVKPPTFPETPPPLPIYEAVRIDKLTSGLNAAEAALLNGPYARLSELMSTTDTEGHRTIEPDLSKYPEGWVKTEEDVARLGTVVESGGYASSVGHSQLSSSGRMRVVGSYGGFALLEGSSREVDNYHLTLRKTSQITPCPYCLS